MKKCDKEKLFVSYKKICLPQEIVADIVVLKHVERTSGGRSLGYNYLS